MRSQPRPRRCRRHPRTRAREAVVAVADLTVVLDTVERVYEAACWYAEDGIVDFSELDLRPAIVILRELVEEQP